ncbi:MAG TPA: glycosyltransferase family 39 protein [Rhodopseudomonas sp.]|uniref:glycosyltransferase family 39 protein n=1 Tax=Rhodopseudomonas sp. TaxID=1078 RepID=UPI002ED9749E
MTAAAAGEASAAVGPAPAAIAEQRAAAPAPRAVPPQAGAAAAPRAKAAKPTATAAPAAGAAQATPGAGKAAPGFSFAKLYAETCDSFLDALRTSPTRLLLWIMGAYGALWFSSTVSFPSMPFDSYEMFLFGKEMQWGYWKHPPLEPWLTEIAYQLTFHWISSHFVLAIGSILATFYFVYLIGAETVGKTGATLAVALTILIYYFGPPVTMYSHNVGQLPIFAATVYIYRKAVLGDKLSNWVLFGVAAAILMYSKYSGALLLAVLALHLLLMPQGRRQLLTRGPYVAALVGLLVLLPNLIWLVQSNFLPFSFAFDRPPVEGFLPRVWAGLKFLFAQLGYHAGILVVGLLALIPKLPLQGEPVAIELDRPSLFDRSLVLMAAFLPLLMIAAMTFWAGVDQRPEIGGSLVALSGLAMVMLLPSTVVLRAPRLVTTIWLLVLIGLPIGHVVFVNAKANGSGQVPTQMWPARELSGAMQAIWNSKSLRRLDIVTGDFKQAGFVALYASPRPSVFIDADFRKSPWITPERLKQSGTLVIWATSDFPRTDEIPAPYRAALQGLTPTLGTMVLPLGHGKSQTYGWAVMLPDGTPTLTPAPGATKLP